MDEWWSRTFERLIVNGAWANDRVHGNRLGQTSSEVLKEWFALQRPIPDVLYHYTSADGLLGILSSNRLWATDAEYMNDSSELNYARARVQGHIEKRAAEASDSEVKEFLTILQRSSDLRGSCHVACFCEKDDLLSQWRGYGRDGGYAIGFDVKRFAMRLFTMQSAHDPTFYLLRKVIYSPDGQDRLIGALIDKSVETLRELLAGAPDDTDAVVQRRALVLTMVQDHLDAYSSCFKDPLFGEECEWRIIQDGRPGAGDDYTQRLKFRRMPGGIAPYLELDLSSPTGHDTGRLPICSVTHGPMLHPELTKRSLDQLLRKHGYFHFEIRGSKIPLRFS